MVLTADICDEFEDKTDVLEGPWQAFGGKHLFSGPIRTVRCFEDNSLVKAALGEPGGGAILVIDAGGSLRAAVVGGNLAKLAAQNGWAGIVVHGAIRDRHEIDQEPIGVLARGTCPRKSVKKGQGERDVPVKIGGVHLTLRDQLFVDGDGVVALHP